MSAGCGCHRSRRRRSRRWHSRRIAPLRNSIARRAATRSSSAKRGNPFFLSEALASDAPGAPPSVSDAVLAKIARRSLDARNLLELVAVVPTRVEWEVVEAIGAAGALAYSAGLDECLATGILQQEGGAIGYRHELARQAVEGALAPARRRALHGAVLRALLDRGAERASLARLAHHAALAEDEALVLRLAPAAAQQASAQGAHREAAAHYATALRYAENAGARRRAELLDGLSQEHYLTGHIEDAFAPCEAALAIWQELRYTEKVGRNLCRLSRLSWFRGGNAEAERYGLAAVEALKTLPPGPELAMAYGNLSHLRMLECDIAQTLSWGERAIELAERLGDTETLSYALNNMGVAQWSEGNDGGREKLERSLALALEHGYEEHVARAYANLTEGMVQRRDFVHAEAIFATASRTAPSAISAHGGIACEGIKRARASNRGTGLARKRTPPPFYVSPGPRARIAVPRSSSWAMCGSGAETPARKRSLMRSATWR